MNRRGFLISGLAALGAARMAAAQRTHRIAVLVHGPERTERGRVEALRAGLKQHGYVEGRNLSLSVTWNDGGLERLPGLAAEMLKAKPDVVVAAPALAAAAVQKHTGTVPIVVMWGAGAVKLGLAKSFARPGLNVTGLETQNEDLTGKRMELLRTIAPGVSRIGVVNSSNYIFHKEAWHAADQTARALKVSLVDVRIGGAEDLPRLAAACGNGGCDGLYVMPGPILINLRAQVIEQAARLRLPAVYFQPEFVEEGGLASYSPNIEDMCRRAAGHVDRILKGAKPGDLPIERPLKFELLINVKTAKSLGLAIPGDLLARADRVIQ
jgi:putative tryptophan/tyrosine transport system substrate-binding protein